MDSKDSVRADPAMAALDDLCQAVRRSIRDAEQVLRRADVIRAQRAEGMAYRDVAPTARALHDEGLSMDRIADLFGVTRQRVSALLRTAESRPPAAVRSGVS